MVIFSIFDRQRPIEIGFQGSKFFAYSISTNLVKNSCHLKAMDLFVILIFEK
jgi:hypothetical protein